MCGFEGRGVARRAGFSLVELMVAVTLLGLVAVGFYSIQHQSQRSISRGERGAEMQQNARSALQMVVGELRSARRIISLDPTAAVFVSDAYVTGQQRRIFVDTADRDHDGATDELVLERSPADDGGPGPVYDEIAEGIRSMNMRYLGGGVSSGEADEVDEPLAVRRIEVAMEARTDDADESRRRALTLSTQVRPRNFGMPLPPSTDSLPPSVPTGLTLTEACGTIVARWNRSPETDVIGYQLYYDVDGGSPPFVGSDADQGSSPIYVGLDTTYTLTGLDPSRTYYLSVRALDAITLSSGYAASVSRRPSDSSAPGVPAGVGVRLLAEDRLEVSWQPVSAIDLASYVVHFDSDTTGAPYSYRDTTGAAPLVLDGLETGKTYYIVVTANDACGNTSAYSTEVSMIPLPCDDDAGPPPAPTGFAGLAGDEWVRVSWNPLSGVTDLAGYRVLFSGPGGSGTVSLGAATSQYLMEGLDNGQTYQFTVRATDVCGNEGPLVTPPLSLVPQTCAGDATPPVEPFGLRVTGEESAGGDRVAVSWTRSEAPDLAGYKVFVESASGWTDTLTTTDIFATVTGLTTGELYYFSVVAYDRCDNLSLPSDEVNGTPRYTCSCPPSASVTTPAEDSDLAGMVMLTASASACSVSTLREVIFYFDEVEVGHFSNPPFMSFFDTRAKPDGEYTFRVRAVDYLGCTGADTVRVRVDNSGAPPACAEVVEGSFGLEGSDHQKAVFDVANHHLSQGYGVQQVMFTWDEPNARLHQVEMPLGVVAWNAPSAPSAAASGTLLPLSPHPTIMAGEVVGARLHYWTVSGSEMQPMDAAVISATFYGSSGVICGPDTLNAECRPEVTNIAASSFKSYVAAYLHENDRYYTDNDVPRITTIPDGGVEGGYEDLVWIKTATADRKAGSGFTLRFDVDRPIRLYLGYDSRYTPPSWIRTAFTAVGEYVTVTDTPARMNLYRKDYPAGRVTLYGNYGTGSGTTGTRNYILLMRCDPD